MKQHLLEKYEYLQRLLKLENETPNRQDFHQKVAPLLLEMAADKAFLKAVIQRNFLDQGFLN